jgi:hypothetical protein
MAVALLLVCLDRLFHNCHLLLDRKAAQLFVEAFLLAARMP